MAQTKRSTTTVSTQTAPSKQAVKAELAKAAGSFGASLPDPNEVPQTLYPPVTLAQAQAVWAAVQPALVKNAAPLVSSFNFGT